MDPLFSVEGKVAVVTGGSRGIGAMISKALVERGARVYIVSRKQGACDATAKELSSYGQCVSMPANVSSTEGVDELLKMIQAREEVVDILVNNAGITWGASLEDFPDKAWDSVMAVNVKAVFCLTQRLLPLLRKAASQGKSSRVINIGSASGTVVAGGLSAFSYSASKAAVHHLTKVLALELVRDNITVNAIAPGYFPSQLTGYFMEDEALLQNKLDQIPMGRMGTPDEIAGLAVYLASGASSYMTGNIIPVDGGIVGCA